MRNYNKDWQSALAGEIDDMARKGLYPHAREAIQDYVGLRDQVRALR